MYDDIESESRPSVEGLVLQELKQKDTKRNGKIAF